MIQILATAPSASPTAPGSQPMSYHDLFVFIAEQEDLDTDETTAFRLAGDSSTEYFPAAPGGLLLVVRAELTRDNGYSANRGAHGGGTFYCFRQQKDKYAFVGTFSGASYSLRQYDDRAVSFETHSHWSASETEVAVWTYDGKTVTETVERHVVQHD
jgi:hypothetical protein